MPGFDEIIDAAESNGGRARYVFRPEPHSTKGHTTLPITSELLLASPQTDRRILSPSALRKLDSPSILAVDPLHELERANRVVKEAKECKKNAEEIERKRRIARKQRYLEKADIMPLVQQELDAPFRGTLPDGITKTALYLSEITGLEPLGVALCILGTTSIATWGRVTVKLSEGWSEPAVDMILQISGSGTRKSSLAQHLRTPLNKFCAQMNDGYENRTKSIKEKAQLAKQAGDKRARKKIEAVLDKREYLDQQDEVAALLKAIEDAVHFRHALAQNNEIPPRVQLLVDKGTPFQLASTLGEQGECQGCITAEGNMIGSKMVSSSEAANLFLRGHTQEPYVYENAKKRIELNHPALPMVNLVQPVVARKFYGNEALNGSGVTARFMPYFHMHATSDLPFSSAEGQLAVYTAKITQLLRLFHTQDRDAPRYQVSVTDGALRRIRRFEEDVRNKMIPYMPEAAEPCLRKAHGQAVRFAWDIHAWNSEQPHLCPINDEEMDQGIDLVRATFPHIEYAYAPCGFVAYGVAQAILESLYRITDRWEQNKLIDDGIDSTTIQQRIGIKSKDVNNALRFLDRHNYLAVYDDASNNLKVALHPYFYD